MSSKNENDLNMHDEKNMNPEKLKKKDLIILLKLARMKIN